MRNHGIYSSRWRESSLSVDDLRFRKHLFQERDWNLSILPCQGIITIDFADNRDSIPSLPPKVIFEPIPPKIPDSISPPTITPQVVTPPIVRSPTPVPTPPPAQEPETRQFAIGCTSPSYLLTTAYLENGQDLRSVFIPSTLRERFLKIAEPNTHQNLETCGILCGVLVLPHFKFC
jgi:STAM-binding protein